MKRKLQPRNAKALAFSKGGTTPSHDAHAASVHMPNPCSGISVADSTVEDFTRDSCRQSRTTPHYISNCEDSARAGSII